MEKYYSHSCDLNDLELKELFINAIKESKMFVSDIEEELLAITKSCIAYPFYDGVIRNLEYLAVKNGHQTTGKMDVSFNLSSPKFLIEEFKTKDFSLELDEYYEKDILNDDEIKEFEKKFINGILDKMKANICTRHNLFLNDKNNTIDIAPIKDFESLNKRFYFEEVVCFTYFDKSTKKTLKSVYSSLLKRFYKLDFIKKEEYKSYLKKYKRPLVYLPKEFYDDYYNLSYGVYLETCEQLKYITSSDLLKKIKSNIEYKSYTKYKEYLNQIIFYYKRKDYLKEFNIEAESLREQIFYYYLTLRHNNKSGLKLAELVKSHILNDSYIRLLEISCKLGNQEAKKLLFEYYNHPATYSSIYLKRYSN